MYQSYALFALFFTIFIELWWGGKFQLVRVLLTPETVVTMHV